MATGDLVTADWMMELDGVAFGGDTAISITEIDGLMDLPEVVTGDQSRLRRHGLHPGDDFLGGRSVTISVEVYAADNAALATAITDLMSITTPGSAEMPLVFQIPGIAGGILARVLVRPRKRSFRVNRDFYYRVPNGAMEFFATDPRIYSNTLNTTTVSVAGVSGGAEFNLTGNISFGSTAEGGTFQATNDGTFEAPVVFKILGPVTNPRIENQTLGKTIELDIVIADTDYVLIDTEDRTVLLNGTASRYSTVTADSEWFHLEPGANSLIFRATTTATGTLTASWRSAWA